MNERAVVLLSGGLDSATCLAWARAQGFECHTLAIDYGQRHRVELEAARRVSAALGASGHREVPVGLRSIGGSALTADIDVPKDRDERAIGSGVPVTYVPARNTVFLAIALGYAETLGARHLVAGMNAIDYSGYPDCRPEFLRAFESLARVATRAGAEGLTPGFWKNHSRFGPAGPEAWTPTGYDPLDSYNTIFSVSVPGNPTLIDALNTGPIRPPILS